jgi:hypothetical protein
MGLAKTILFGDNPAHDGIRRAMSEAAGRRIVAFPFLIPTRRKNRIRQGPYWDPFWPSSVSSAAKELGIETILVNSRCCTRTQEQADTIRSRAEKIHAEKIADWERRFPKF